MANDNDKNRPHGSILNREPNTLDKIGSRDYTKSYLSDVAIMERRAAIETVEMRRLQQRMQDIERIRTENTRRYAHVAAGQMSPTEQMFREAGVRADVASELVTKLSSAPNQLATAYTTAVTQFGTKLTGRQAQYQTEYDKLKELAQVNASRMFVNRAISTAGSEAGIASLTKDPNVMAMAERYAGAATDIQLTKGYERAQSARMRAGVSLEEAAQFAYTPEGKREYLAKAQSFEEARRKEAALYGALRSQGRAGLTVEGMQQSGAQIESAILAEQRRSELAQRVATGATGSFSKESAELKNREQEFLKTLKELNDEFKRTGDVSRDLREAFAKSKDSLKEQQELVDEMRRQGGGGGGRFARGMSMVAQIGGPLLDAARYGFVGSDVQQMNLRIGAAQFANQRYTDQLAATQGDMAALRRVTQRQQDAAAAYGRTYGARETAISTGEIGVGIAGAIAGGAAGAAAGSLLGGVGAIPGALIGGIGGAAYAVNKAVSVGKGIPFAQQQQMSAAQYQDMMNTVNAVPDAARQRFFDYRMSAYQSMMGAGSAFSGMYAGATSQKAIETLAAQGLGPEEGAALFGFGARSIGAGFTRAGAGAQLGMVSRAGQLQALGVMSAQEYMGRIGQMAQTGGAQKDVEDVLAAAVARGVDDAKSLSGMFENIQALSRDAASKGVGVAPIVGAQMAFGMQQLKDLPRDEMLKQAQMASGLARFSQMATTTGIDFATMSAFAGLSSIMPSRSTEERVGIGRTLETPIEVMRTQMRELSKFKKGDIIPKAIIAGLKAPSAFVDDEGRYLGAESVKQVIAERLVSQIAGRSAGLISQEEGDKIRQAIVSGKGAESLSVKTIKTIQNVFGAGAAEMLAFGGEGAGVATKGVGPLSDGADYARRMKEAGARGQAGQIIDAGRLADGMDNLAQAMAQHMESVAESINALASATETAKAAEAMKLDTSSFDASISNFDAAVTKLVEAVRPLGSSMPIGGPKRQQIQGK